ncbi:hypothetical protein AgCh_027327 [Apium graveolens]
MNKKDVGVKIPFLDKDNYHHWKVKMHLHLLSQDEGYVDCIERGLHVPMRAATGNEPSVAKPRMNGQTLILTLFRLAAAEMMIHMLIQHSKGEFVVSNAGDCRVVICRGGDGVALTSDHRPSREDEKNRIVALPCRGLAIIGSLAVSRGIGDEHLKQWVTAEPEIKVVAIEPNFQFLILASDANHLIIKCHQISFYLASVIIEFLRRSYLNRTNQYLTEIITYTEVRT